MRPGHSLSGSFQERFQTDSQVHTVLKAIKQHQLVDQNGSQRESSCVDQSFGGNLTVHIKDALELSVEVLYGPRTQRVENSTAMAQWPRYQPHWRA
jgi:hypothetical protein